MGSNGRLRSLTSGISPHHMTEQHMPSKAQRIAGWVMTGLVGLFLIGASGVPKFIDFPGEKEMFDKLGITADLSPILGVIEIAVSLFFLIPRTSFLGAIQVTNRARRNGDWKNGRGLFRPFCFHLQQTKTFPMAARSWKTRILIDFNSLLK